MSRTFLAAATCALAVCSAPQPFQRWADEARVPTVPRLVALSLDGCPEAPGRSCTQPGLSSIWLAPTRTPRHDLLHELGHLFDYFELDDSARARFLALRSERRPWRSSPNSPHEQFAEAYALCAAGPARLFAGHVLGGYDYTPTLRVHQRVCALIRGVRV